MHMKPHAPQSRPLIFAIALLLCTGFGALWLPSSAYAADASFSLYPTTGTLTVGSSISVGVFLTSPHTKVNAASASLSFPADALEVTSIDTTNSILNLWVEQPTYSNDTGSVRFGGVAFNPGFSGANGRVMTIRFKVKTANKALIRFVSGLVLANDGHGTELATDISSMSTLTALPGGTTVPPPNNNTTQATGSTDPQVRDFIASEMPIPAAYAEILILLFAIAAVITALYNGYRLRRIEGVARGTTLTLHEKDVLKKLKKDLDKAEDTIVKMQGPEKGEV